MLFPLPPEAELRAARARVGVRRSSKARVFRVLFGVFVASSATPHAGPIYWGTNGQVRHRSVCGNSGDCASLAMSLGVFRADFTPSPDNVGRWRENWMMLSEAVYDPEERRFAGIADATSPLPDGYAPQVYIWSFDGTDLTKGPRWLLLTNPEWQWNGGGSTVSPARTWIADDAVRAILGSIDSGGFLLSSVQVRPEEIPADEWLAEHFPQNSAHADPDADPDGDGLTNRLEYFLGTHPGKGSSIGRLEMRVETGAVRLALSRNPHAVSTFVLETSEDLRMWKPAAAEVVTDQPDQVELLTPKSAGGKPLFFRFQLRGSDTP